MSYINLSWFIYDSNMNSYMNYINKVNVFI